MSLPRVLPKKVDYASLRGKAQTFEKVKQAQALASKEEGPKSTNVKGKQRTPVPRLLFFVFPCLFLIVSISLMFSLAPTLATRLTTSSTSLVAGKQFSQIKSALFTANRVRMSKPQTRSITQKSQAHKAPQPLSHVNSMGLFATYVGIGTCPKRRSGKTDIPGDAGEDAYFTHVAPGKTSLGVLDGVGGWADMGVDPSIFSKGLAGYCKAEAKRASLEDASGRNSQEAPCAPLQILQRGYDELQKDPSIRMGSSTACIATLDHQNGELQVANLGDSGFFIISSDSDSSSAGKDKESGLRIKYASKAQTYFFNAPYQLSKMPASMRSSGSLENVPRDADVTRHSLQEGDIAIFATDGFFDNVFLKDALALIAPIVTKHAGVESHEIVVDQIAKVLTEEAKKAGRSRRKNGPFAQEAKAHNLRFEGGKEDDIVVLALQIKSLNSAEKGVINASPKL